MLCLETFMNLPTPGCEYNFEKVLAHSLTPRSAYVVSRDLVEKPEAFVSVSSLLKSHADIRFCTST